MRKLPLLVTAFGLATAAFWGTILTAPPTTKAALSSPETDVFCAGAEQGLATRLNAERDRRKQAGNARLDDLHRIQAGLRKAQHDCQAGRAAVAMSNFQAVAGMLVRAEARRSITN